MFRGVQKPHQTPKQRLIPKPKSALQTSIEKSANRLKSRELKYKLRNSKVDPKLSKEKASRNTVYKPKPFTVNTLDNCNKKI